MVQFSSSFLFPLTICVKKALMVLGNLFFARLDYKSVVVSDCTKEPACTNDRKLSLWHITNFLDEWIYINSC